METVTLTIDGRPVTVEKGKTVLQAAIESGIKIPYYCYHPGLGIDGSCRVCIVKIEKMPKLQTSCSTPVAEGMVVSTQTPDVVEARASVFEFLLINHPLDCPVCDKGGECPLQDFSYSFGPNESRMEFPRRVFDGEGVQRRRRFRPDADAQPQPLHPVHALRPVHARGRRRRADQHHRSRLRQRDRHVPGRRRALAALGQPDGRLPGRRDHDARLPLQVAPVGQPGRGRHDLHALREGLQHHRVDQGQAGMGQGRAADPRYAAVQPGRQRLLDVRHRPLRLSLDRRRRAPAAAAAARGSRRARADGLDERASTKLADRVDGGAAVRRRCGSSSRRTRRSKSCSSSAGSAARSGCRKRASRSAGGYREKPQPPSAKFKMPPVDAPNVNGARDLGLPGQGDGRSGEAGCRRVPRARSSRAACRRCTCSIRARTDRSATCRGSSRRAKPDGCRCSSSRAC